MPDPLDEAERRLRLAEVRDIDTLVERIADTALDARSQARATSISMAVEFLRSRFDIALRRGREAATLWDDLGEAGEAAVARAIVGRILVNAGASEDALQEVLAAHDAAERSGQIDAIMRVDTAVGHVYFGIQRYDQALDYFGRALDKARLLGDRILEGSMTDAFAAVEGSKALSPARSGTDEGRLLLESAARLSETAILIARETGHRFNEGQAVANRAESLMLLGRPLEALALLESWVHDPTDLDRVTCHLRDTEGMVCLELADHDAAIDHFLAAHDHADTATNRMNTCRHLADVYERTGDLVRALDFYKQYHGHFQQVGSEAAQRSASVAAVRLETVRAQEQADEQRDLAARLKVSNEALQSQADNLTQLSFQDALTGLGNRRALDQLLDAGSDHHAIAMIDVDHFKRVNDGWSHAIGDAVLRQLATLIKGSCRVVDTAVRSGGEEFAVVFDSLDDPSTRNAAERIRKAVESFDWVTIAPGLHVTVSIGVASGVEASDGHAVLAIADRRLYEAKNGGRNRVIGLAG